MQNKIKNRKTKCHIRTCSGYPEKWIPAINARMTQYQRGRSMVEMLGVLAVMGVLSVGGVAMYINAMNKYRANELLNEASKRAVMVAGQLLTNPSATTMSLSQFGSNAVAGATFGENATISNGKITLTVSGVETAVCNQMIAATGTNSAMQVAPGCGTITFNADMSKGGTTTSSGCPKAGYTGDNCDERVVCQNGGTWTENGCECPSNGMNGPWTGVDCSVCDGYMDPDGYCYPCDYADGPDGAFMTTSEECAKCGNQREFIQVEENVYYCVVTDCGEGKFRSDLGYCHSCSSEYSVDTDSTQCAKCDGTAYPRKMQDNHCVPNW